MLKKAIFAACAILLPHMVAPASASPAAVTAQNCDIVSGPGVKTATRIKFKKGKTGTVVARCAFSIVEFLDSFPLPLAVTYQDSDGTGASTSVKAYIVAVSKFDGTSSASLVFDSSDFLEANVAWNLGSSSIANNGNYYYYLRIELRRKSTSRTAAFLGSYMGNM